MTSYELETQHLSLHYWLTRCVLPAALLLLVLLALLPQFITVELYKDQTSAVFGFFILYFVLVRGGHLIMIRSMHFELKQTYGEAYDECLMSLPANMHRHNLGFSLARIKRRLIDARMDSRRHYRK